jgi:hypothetical protein
VYAGGYRRELERRGFSPRTVRERMTLFKGSLRAARNRGPTARSGHCDPQPRRPPSPSPPHPSSKSRTSRKAGERRKAHGRTRCRDRINRPLICPAATQARPVD